MIYLIISILLTSSFFVIFRLYQNYNISTVQALVINYIVCLIESLFFIDDLTAVEHSIKSASEWIMWGLVLGFLFISIFYLVALTTQRIGVTVASVAAKIAMVMPVLAAIFIFRTAEHYTWTNYLGVVLAIAAVVLASLKEQTAQQQSQIPVWQMVLLPIGVFVGSGLIDTLFAYTSNTHLHSDADRALFSCTLFAMAALLGVVWVAIRLMAGQEKLALRNVLGGLVLGIPNYFSVYFLLKALQAYNNDGAFVYPVANIGVILMSALVAMFAFKEKLLLPNKLGLGLAVLAIVLIAS